MDEKVVKVCMACGDYGHHYYECPKYDFWGSVYKAFGLGPKPWVHLSDKQQDSAEPKHEGD